MDSPNHDALVALVVQQHQKLKRGPYGIDKALQKAKQADTNSLQRILFDESETAWRAFYVANKASASEHGFRGKAALARLLNDLHTRPVAYQRTFAAQLASAMNEGEEVDGPPQGTKRLRTENTSMPSTLLPVALTAAAAATTDSAALVPSIDFQHLGELALPQQNIYLGAPLGLAEELFHAPFWDAIQRIPGKDLGPTAPWLADISLFFQQDQQAIALGNVGCQMDIGIVEEQVANLASDYFGVRLECKDGIRSVSCPEGGRIEPAPAIKLRACKKHVSGLFRGDLFTAVCTSPLYQCEEAERRSRTSVVSMTVTNQPKEGGKLHVLIGGWRATTVKTRLYG